jgi:hypothetical protein
VEGVSLSYQDVRTLASGAMQLFEFPEMLAPLEHFLRERARRFPDRTFPVDVDEICDTPGLAFMPIEPAIWTGLDGRGDAIRDVIERAGLGVLSMENDVIRFRHLDPNAAMFRG